MKHIIEELHDNIDYSALWNFYFGDMKTGVLDIETTGLNPALNSFVLGCVTGECEGKLHQFLAENRGEEEEALMEYAEYLSGLDAVVTYNGRNFDIPFIERRLGKFGRTGVSMPYDLDIYQVVNGYSTIRKHLPNLKQKTLESYMGFWSGREDEISGAESADLYYHYEKTEDPEAERKILLHNNDDVRQLRKLTAVTAKCDFHKAMFRMGFPIKGSDEESPLLCTDRIQLKGNSIVIEGSQRVRRGQTPLEYVSYPMELMSPEGEFSAGNCSFRIRIPILRRAGLAMADISCLGESHMAGFDIYPGCESGYLVVEDRDGPKYREINHLVKAVVRSMV